MSDDAPAAEAAETTEPSAATAAEAAEGASDVDDSGSTTPDGAERDGLDPADASLVVDGLSKRFGGINAVDGVSFAVERGTLTGLIGPNGAGKSTTFDLITGVHDPDGGRVTFEGREITGYRTAEIADEGLVRTFQIARELEEMTVLENLMLAPRGQSGEKLVNAVAPGLRGRVREEERELREAVWDTLELFEIDHLAEEYAGNLSGGQRKLLELARALMVDPSMLLLDEPFAGVNPTLEEKLLDRVHELREEGLTFLLVEHDMDLIMEHCERVVVMHQGRVLAEGTPAEIRSNERVVDAYLGEDL
ncbi:ABC transporter ATP-binding protein [Halosimplex pelagicum]|uniref:Probable branched-chain amino acid transport ATP-binding protein LivG n=1 Tax=Halosimplex pelagicum TaxID=869886 RepID=A0A7D5P8R8_9EURY|nr:ABC transporter ATP-binding protein [Halosimplex pelagicum]QLH83606.1 ABC transporter ATP-binding protein [Halosimplex pelagicum]